MQHRITLEVETGSPSQVLDGAINGALCRVPGTRILHSRVTEISGEPVKIRLLLSRFSDGEIRVVGSWLESETGMNDWREDVEEIKRTEGPMYEYRFMTISTAGFSRAFEVPAEEGEVTDVK